MRYREEEGERHIEQDGWRREAEATEKPKAKPANAEDWPRRAVSINKQKLSCYCCKGERVK